ncbi:HK97 family phage prohead protease [Mesorhizobium sp. M4B.F.Ca.ET.190.01.1.1]|uniref:HK97 family phage prohead protease n=1 Tax=unclassified Mesorhizobium TaxID=325217 RepID=UPI00109249D0|nr:MULTISPECIES: HK97 family phage prohead protease [unclassified Mesorhizobium]TGR05408.1 HK97 family phage prohead protease [Mesorhizobium sp. M4B.F.Ca.ET.200.01.1.1]TGS15664.1 HK97 family phage prohead protease [Mesorhizobium sp. M4B.F.Ca.ET.190.01.1.1]TGT27724.1 HK97 family phage prohead protease [Mesorhizobium sp. M4B.F.Ca.ET.172.01.1.1]
MIAGYATDFTALTNGRTLIQAGAFTNLLHRRFTVRMLVEHEGEQVGEWVKMMQDDRGLFVVGRLDGSARARETMAGIESGRYRGLSLGRHIGLRALRDDGINVCADVQYIGEISLVHEPGNPGALIEAFCMVGQ